MKKVEQHELFGTPFRTAYSFEKWYMSSRNIYDIIQSKTGHTYRNHCRVNNGGSIPSTFHVFSPAQILTHTPSKGYYFSGQSKFRMPKSVETITAYDIKEIAAMNTLDVDVTVDVFLWHFRMYKTLSNYYNHAKGWEKRLLKTVIIPANEIVSLLSNFKLDNLDTDAFTMAVIPRELSFSYRKSLLGGAKVAGVHVTTSFTKTSTIHTKKTISELYDLGHFGQGTDETQHQVQEIVDTSEETEKSALTNTSNTNVSAIVATSSQRPDNIKVIFKEDQVVITASDQDFPLHNINRQIFDTKEGVFRQIVSMSNSKITGTNDLGASINKFFIATNEGFEEEINQLTFRDLNSNINYTVRPTKRVGDSRPAPPPYVIEGDKKSNYISLWQIDDLIIIEDTRKDLVPDAKIRATLIRNYKQESNSQNLQLDSVQLSITFVCIGVFSLQLGELDGSTIIQNHGPISHRNERGSKTLEALRSQDTGHFEYEVIVEQFDRNGNFLGDKTITLDSTVDGVPNIKYSAAYDSFARKEDDFWIKNRIHTKTIDLHPILNKEVQNISIKSSQAKLKSSTNWKPTEIAKRRDVFTINGKELADKPLTSVTNFTVTVIDGETSGKKTFRLSWTSHDEPSDDIVYGISMKGTSVVINEEVGTVKTRNANRFFSVDKNATSLDIPEDEILGQAGSSDAILLTDDILDESRFEFKFRKLLEIDTGRYRPNTNAIATSIVIYEGSEFSTARIQDTALITSSSEIYYQTKGLYYGISYSPNLYYISRDKGANGFSFSGHGIYNINVCDFHIVIKGRPQSDLKVDLWNYETFVERSTDLHGSLLFWDGDNFDTFSFHGVKKESMWTIIKVPIKRFSSVNRIKISSVSGGYTFDTGTLPFTRHPDYSFGYNTNIIQSRKTISVRDNWENNTGHSGPANKIIGHIRTNRRTEVTTFNNDAKDDIKFVNTFNDSGVSHGLGRDMLNQKMVQTPSRLDFSGDVFFDDDYPHLLRPVVNIYYKTTDSNDISTWTSHSEVSQPPFTSDSTTGMSSKKTEILLSQVVQARTSTVDTNEHTQEQAQEVINNAKVIVEVLTPSIASTFVDDPKFGCKIKISIEDIDLQGLYGDRGRDEIKIDNKPSIITVPFDTTGLGNTVNNDQRRVVLRNVLRDLKISVASSESNPEYETQPVSILSITVRRLEERGFASPQLLSTFPYQ